MAGTVFRRTSVCLFVAMLAAVSGGGAARGVVKAESLVVTGFGGTWNDCMLRTVIQPFERQFKADVILTLPGNSAQIAAKVIAEKGNPSIDVPALGIYQGTVIAAGAMAKINYPKAIKNWKQLAKGARGSPAFGPGIMLSGIGIGYNPEKLPFVPNSWLDLWRPEARNHVAVFSPVANYGVASIAVINSLMGGTKTNVTPAFNKFKALGPSRPIVMANDNDAQVAFVQRDVWISPMTTSPAITLARQGVPIKFVYPKEGGIFYPTVVGVTAGSKNRVLALKFINFWLDAKVQGNWSTCVGYVPTNTEAVFPKSYVYSHVLQGKKGFPLDWGWITGNFGTWLDRWNSEVAPAFR